MSWHLTDVPSTASGYMVTGIITYVPPVSEPSPYMSAPHPLLDSSPNLYPHMPPPDDVRVWKDDENTVWCLTIEYRKPSLGEPGILGTYRLYERAIKALAEYAEDHYDRALTEQEVSDGAIYGCDETLEIVEQHLEGCD